MSAPYIGPRRRQPDPEAAEVERAAEAERLHEIAERRAQRRARRDQSSEQE